MTLPIQNLMMIKTADICDADAHAQVCELPFRRFGKRGAFAGHIRTAQHVDGLGVLPEFLKQPGEGQVLVIDGAGLEWRALFGERMAGLAIENGWAGIVVNGRIRDSLEIDRLDIGVWALGTTPRRMNLGNTGLLNVPVHFGGLTFTPGARLVADEDGLIVLSPDQS